uniref:Uncharacterized protein n=1 Tax=Sciurus vulgaris TaxID=55149 RepID=A0A8D2DNZ5_SCIVU
MRVPGDIVSALLQGHRARRAGFGVAASGGCGKCPAREGAEGPAGQESQPRAGAQRGAHCPCADLAPGRDQGQGCFLASQFPHVSRATGLSRARSSGSMKGISKG